MAKIPYASAVGSLMYAMVATCPNITFAVGAVGRYIATPSKKHWETIKSIMRYLKGTMHMCICFANANLVLHGLTDSKFARCVDKRKSTIGYVLTLSGGAIS